MNFGLFGWKLVNRLILLRQTLLRALRYEIRSRVHDIQAKMHQQYLSQLSLVSVLWMNGIAYRLQLTFYHCLPSSVRYKMSSFPHQLLSFVLCFHHIFSFTGAVVSVARAFLSSPRILCYWCQRCVVCSCWRIKIHSYEHVIIVNRHWNS